MIGVIFSGVVFYVLDVYGGLVSDRMIFERLELFNKGMFEKGDSIMVDRGIMV